MMPVCQKAEGEEGNEFECHDGFRLDRATSKTRFSEHRRSSKSWGQLSVDLDDEDMDDPDDGYRIDLCFLPYMIQPNSLMRVNWDLAGCLLIFYDAVMIPLQAFSLPDTIGIIFTRWFVRVFWTLDLIVCMFSGFHTSDGRAEMRFTRTMCRYAQSWLFVDLVIVSVSWLEAMAEDADSMNAARGAKGLKGLRIIRVIRLMRVFRLIKNTPDIFSSLAYVFKSEWVMILLSILKIMGILAITTHFISCAWYSLGEMNRGAPAWVEYYGVADRSIRDRYALSFHWALTLFISNSEIYPHTDSELSFAIVCVLCSFMASIAAVSSITTSMTQLQIIASRDARQLSTLRRFLQDNDISSRLAMRVQRNAQWMLAEQQKVVSENRVELFSQLSEPLRIDIHYELYGPVLKWHPFFRNYSQHNAPALRQVCHVAISQLKLCRGDILFSTGELPKVPLMYFLTAGRLLYIRPHVMSVTLLHGQWACEPSIWCPWTCRGILRASSECSLSCVNAERFQTVAEQFKSLHFYPAQYAVQFVDELNSLEKQDLSDVDEGYPNVAAIIERVFPAFENGRRSTRGFLDTITRHVSH